MSTPACEAFQEVAPELALGIADGADRAVALDHLADCADCRRLLDDLTATLDDLLVAAPIEEPPPSFEAKALASFEQETASSSPPLATPSTNPAPPAPPITSRSGSGTSRPWLVAAAILAICALALAGVAAWSASNGGSSNTVATAAGILRTPEGGPVGRVHIEHHASSSASGGSELVVSVAAGAPTGTYRVQCDYESGRPYDAGELTVDADGLRRWSASVSVPTYDLRRVRLISTTGTTNLEAEIPA